MLGRIPADAADCAHKPKKAQRSSSNTTDSIAFRRRAAVVQRHRIVNGNRLTWKMERNADCVSSHVLKYTKTTNKTACVFKLRVQLIHPHGATHTHSTHTTSAKQEYRRSSLCPIISEQCEDRRLEYKSEAQ